MNDERTRFPVAGRLLRPIRIGEQQWPPDALPLVSILCITYNQEQFLPECLEGLLKQETTFPVEIIVHDDASSDGSADIIRAYQERYPRLIRAVIREENKGHKIFASLFPVARGEFMALCEGDDYWTEPSKLERQIQLLRRHPSSTCCFHPIYWLEQSTGTRFVTSYGAPSIKPQYELDDLLEHSNIIPTCSVIMRASAVRNLPGWYFECPLGDWALHVVTLARSKESTALMYPMVMGVYRRHSGGAHGGQSAVFNATRLLKAYHVAGSDPSIRDLPAYFRGLQRRKAELRLAIVTQLDWARGLFFSWRAFETSIWVERLSFAARTAASQVHAATTEAAGSTRHLARRLIPSSLKRTIRSALRSVRRDALVDPNLRHHLLSKDARRLEEAPLSSLIAEVRERAIAYVDAQRFSESIPTYRYSRGGWPSLYGSVYAVMVKSLAGQLENISPAERSEWVSFINAYQCGDGLYRDPLLENAIAETEDWWGWRHLSAHVVSALAMLGGRSARPITFVESLYQPGVCDAWLGALPWAEKPDFVSNTVMNYGVLLQYNRDAWHHAGAGQALDSVFSYLNNNLDPASGLWGYDASGGTAALSRGIQTSYHLWNLYSFDKRPIPYAERAVDHLLASQNEIGGFGPSLNSSACEDIDSIDPLCRFYFALDYRREDIARAIERAIRWVAVNQMADGGFVFRRFEGFTYGHPLMSTKAEESSLFATWFRLLSIAYMSEVISPGATGLWFWCDVMGYQFAPCDEKRNAHPALLPAFQSS